MPALDVAGYVLRIREPAWFEHRLFNGSDVDVNVHVSSAGLPRDRADDSLPRPPAYASGCDRVARRAHQARPRACSWHYVQQYANAKSDVVAEIMTRAQRPRTTSG